MSVPRPIRIISAMKSAHVIVFLICSATLAVSNAWIVNQRDRVPEQFELLTRADLNKQHEFRIALKQKNIDILEATLLEVADPGSKHYGKWWTSDKILDLIAPSKESIEPVISWLKSHPISEINVSGRDFIKVIARVEAIESMFNTEMYDFRSKENGHIFARAFGSVHVPDHYMDTIEMVTGLTELVPKSYAGLHEEKRSVEQSDPLGQVFPNLLRVMYDIPSQFPVHPKSSLGFVQYESSLAVYFPDITLFNIEMNENVSLDRQHIVGPFSSSSRDTSLSVQYGGALALNTTLWYWTVEQWLYEAATELFNAKSYPLVVLLAGGLPEEGQCEITGHCVTNSTQESYDYVKRVNVEFAKLGLKGITLVSRTSNNGAPGEGHLRCSGGLSNTFPASSPWVTAVGATMLITDPDTKNLTVNMPPACKLVYCARTKREGTCTYPNAFITSGGGFSNVSAMPGWQRKTVRSYLKSGVKLPTGLFDPTKRAYPDVAVNGHNLLMFYSNLYPRDATAGSSSVFAAIISLLNSLMLNNGKNPLGFINPLLYKMAADDPAVFTDIATGNNYCTKDCCGKVGYVATTGWDPVTGLGTPVFSKMQSYIQRVLINK